MREPRRSLQPVPSPAAPSDPADKSSAHGQPVAVERNRLANGLDVILLENHAVPIVTIEIDVHNGACYESEPYDGLSHLYEHMFFKANERIPDQERYLRRTRELGMEWNGTTSEERVNYYFTLQSRDLEAGLRFMSDAIRTPLFLKEELERERQVVLGEYDRAESDPSFHLYVDVGKALWGADYVRKNVIGTRSIIETATREKMFHIQKRFYIPNNSALLLAGDIEVQPTMALVESIFGSWATGPDPRAAQPVPQPAPLLRPATRVVERPVHAVTCMLAWHGPSVELDRRETYVADVLTFIIGQRTSRFYRRLVDSGLASSASLHYHTLRYTGPLQAHVVAAPERAAEAHAALVEEIAALATSEAFTEDELVNARRQLEIDRIYEAERPSQLTHTLGYWWAIADLDYFTDYAHQVRSVTRDEVHAFAQRFLKGRPCVTGFLVAPDDVPKLGALATEAGR